MYCKNCGQQISDGAAVCLNCGAAVEGANTQANFASNVNMVYCRNCGKQIRSDAAVCINCGCATGNTGGGASALDNSINPGFVVLSLFVPLFGIIYGIMKINEGKKRSGQTYLWCGAGVFLFWFLCVMAAFL